MSLQNFGAETTRMATQWSVPPAPGEGTPAPVVHEEEVIYEAPFKETAAYRTLNYLGVLDPKDPTGKTALPNRRYIRATLPDGKGGVDMEAIYRIDAITDRNVSMSYVIDWGDRKEVRASIRGGSDNEFWSGRVFLVVTEKEWKQGKVIA